MRQQRTEKPSKILCRKYLFLTILFWRPLKTGPRPRPYTWEKRDSLKIAPVPKTGLQKLKMLLFVSSHMKDIAEMIRAHIKSRGVQSLAFVQIMSEKCTTNFYLERSEFGIKTSCQFVALITMECVRRFTYFYATSRTRHIFTELVSISESSIKIKIGSHWTLFVIWLTLAITYK